MSAWICTPKHVAVLVLGANDALYTKHTPEELQKIANALMRENVRSVNYRYNERTRVPKIDMAKFAEQWPEIKDEYSTADLIMAARCLRYQSCERPDYDNSKARRLTDQILVTLYEYQFEDAVRKMSSQWGID